MKKQFLALILIFLFSLSYSQSRYIRGKLIDAKTQESIPYVNIYIKGTNIGTVSNIEGKFNLFLKKPLQKDTLVFSYIGYKNIELLAKNIKTDILIKLNPYIEQTQGIIVKAKKTDPIEILKNASNNIKENIYDSAYYTNVFIRNFIKKDSSFILYRKTLTKTLAMKDDLWFVKGSIIADKYLSYNSWIKELNEKEININTLFSPPIDYMRMEVSKKTYKKKVIRIDTVMFSEKNKIYVIDVFSKKINTETLKNIHTVIDKTPNPYTLIFDTCLQDIGKYFLQNNNIQFLRYFIDAKQNYNIIKEVIFFVSSTGNKKTFEYIISDFNNLPKQSSVEHIVAFKENIITEKTTKALYLKSLFESFCYNKNYNIDTLKSANNTVRDQYLEKINLNKQSSYNNWSNQETYIKTDSLEIEAIKQIESIIKLEDEKN